MKGEYYNGEWYESRKELADHKHVPYGDLCKLLNKGIKPEIAVEQLLAGEAANEINEIIDGKLYTSYSQIAEAFDVPIRTLKIRLSKGWTLFEAICGARETKPEVKKVKPVIVKEEVEPKPIQEIECIQEVEPEIAEQEIECVQEVEVETAEQETESVQTPMTNVPIFPELSTQIVTSIPMLLNTIRIMRPKKINLIDFENIAGKCRKDLISTLNDKDTVNIFFFNSLIYSSHFYCTIRGSETLNLQVLTFEVARQLVDDLIKFYLGILIPNFPTAQYIITSTDHGYTALVDALHMTNIIVEGVGAETDDVGESRYKRALADFIWFDSGVKDGTCLREEEIKGVFKNFLRRFPDNKQRSEYTRVKRLVKDLCVYRFVNPVYNDGTNEILYYTLNMDEVERTPQLKGH